MQDELANQAATLTENARSETSRWLSHANKLIRDPRAELQRLVRSLREQAPRPNTPRHLTRSRTDASGRQHGE